MIVAYLKKNSCSKNETKSRVENLQIQSLAILAEHATRTCLYPVAIDCLYLVGLSLKNACT